jgi:hypothetical protein
MILTEGYQITKRLPEQRAIANVLGVAAGCRVIAKSRFQMSPRDTSMLA